VIGRHFSLILLPTNECNVACDYCFEDKARDFLSLAELRTVTDKVLATWSAGRSTASPCTGRAARMALTC